MLGGWALAVAITLVVGLPGEHARPTTRWRGPCVAAALPRMDTAGTRADSLALAAEFERTPPGDGSRCGEFLAGYLIGMTSTPAEDEWQERLRGLELLDEAFREFGTEPRLYLARALLLYHRQARTDALRMLDRALARRDESPALRPRELMLIHYTRGLIHQDFWRDWRSYGQLKTTAVGQWGCGNAERPEGDNFTSSSSDHTWLLRLNQICPDRFARNMAEYFDRRDDMRRDEFDALEAAFEEALAADTTSLLSGEALLGEYVYLGMWGRAEALVERLRARMPDHATPFLYEGLVLHETSRDSLASIAFANAFRRMDDSLAASYEDIAALLTPDQRTWFLGADSVTQRAAVTAFWNSLDPLYLTVVNERKLEHFARVVTADLLFTSAALRERGSASHAGLLWIRYGRPAVAWELSSASGRIVFWDYGPGPDATFIRGTAYRSYRPTDQGIQVAEALQLTTPQTYAADAVLDSVWRLGHQVVRVIGPDGRPAFLVYAEWPEEFSPQAVAGLALLDARFLPVAQWRGGPPERPGLHVDLRAVPRGTYSLTVEAFDPPTRLLGRVRDSVSTLVIDDSAFGVSDLLLTSAVRPLRGEDAVGRQELAIEPLYRMEVRPGQAIGLVWEVYRPAGGRDGRIEYDVEVEVQNASRQPVLARVLHGVGIRGERDPATRIAYHSQRPMRDGRTVEWLELSGLPEPGEYRVVLVARDRENGVEVRRERALRVRRPD